MALRRLSYRVALNKKNLSEIYWRGGGVIQCVYGSVILTLYSQTLSSFSLTFSFCFLFSIIFTLSLTVTTFVWNITKTLQIYLLTNFI